ncbi:MAG: hypothetical protein KGS61_12700 [Verrucomicrobia bacterium]|nr:hypothetical protein [Verrucomicrobiota bacterium]
MNAESENGGRCESRRLVKTAEAMRLLSCSRRTLERMAGEGQLTRVKIRHATRYILGELLARIAGGGVA